MRRKEGLVFLGDLLNNKYPAWYFATWAPQRAIMHLQIPDMRMSLVKLNNVDI